MNRQTRNLLPLLAGVCIGLLIQMQIYKHYNFTCDENNNYEYLKESINIQTKGIHNKRDEPMKVKKVKPKSSRFNYDFRPYFVYSELGFKYQIVIAVKTNEERLKSFAVAINNTWSEWFQSVIFFTPYSKNENFHNTYVKKLNLNVIQLPDIMDNTLQMEFSFRILQYMKEHYIHQYSWFVQVEDNIYVNAHNLKEFLQTLDSSEQIFLGHQDIIKRSSVQPTCGHQSGIVLSRTALLNLVPQNCPRKEKDFGLALSQCLYNNLHIKCESSGYLLNSNYFLINYGRISISEQLDDSKVKDALMLSPFTSTRDMLMTHKYFVMKHLTKAFDDTQNLQEKIRKSQVKLPDNVPEKILNWPIGFPAPFKPTSRFEVIQWTFFDKRALYGFTDLEPKTYFSNAYYKDLKEILNTVKQAIQRKTSGQFEFDLLNGYHRLDPTRGAEYIIDMKVNNKYTKESKVERYQLLRPFSKIEPLSMPPATEQKGIHLVLPVTRDDVSMFERFLQMYKRICLQTGENVVLLTVFVNIRNGQFENDEKEDPFAQSKDLITRYKHSYMWAQLPWLQVGVKQMTPVLIMDIVAMKLPYNSLIFFVTGDTDFTVNFLNRCRVNVISGMQVFFPIPFMDYDPYLVYAGKQKPAFAEVHKTTGTWNLDALNIACFYNQDYKETRMWRKDFLDEKQPMNETIFSIFQSSKLHLFRAIEAELRTRYVHLPCSNVTDLKRCHLENAERLGNRAQLAQLIFEQGYIP